MPTEVQPPEVATYVDRVATLDVARGSWRRLPDSGTVGNPIWFWSAGRVVNCADRMSKRPAERPSTADVIARSLREHTGRRAAVALTVVYLLIYLLAIQNLVISPGTNFGRFVHIPSVQVASDWPSKLFRQRAAFYYEPVLAIYPMNHVALYVSPVNMAMGIVLGSLLGINVATALYTVRGSQSLPDPSLHRAARRASGFLTGFACCVPSLALLLGAHFTLALIAVRSYFFPFALAALALSLTFNARRVRQLSERMMAETRVDPAGV